MKVMVGECFGLDRYFEVAKFTILTPLFLLIDVGSHYKLLV
jgi:hypothetical protein